MADVRDKIKAAIAAGGDLPASTLLIIMLDVLDDIKDEISQLRGDIPGMRAAVLNGHVDVHHDHHERIEDERVEDEIALSKGEPTAKDIRTWARMRIADEVTTRSSRRTILDGWIIEGGKIVISSALTALAIGYMVWTQLGG